MTENARPPPQPLLQVEEGVHVGPPAASDREEWDSVPMSGVVAALWLSAALSLPLAGPSPDPSAA